MNKYKSYNSLIIILLYIEIINSFFIFYEFKKKSWQLCKSYFTHNNNIFLNRSFYNFKFIGFRINYKKDNWNKAENFIIKRKNEINFKKICLIFCELK